MIPNSFKHEKNLSGYPDWFLKIQELTVLDEEESDQKNDPVTKSNDLLRHRESEQTQQLLVGLVQELYNKIEKLESKRKSKAKESKSTKNSKDKESKSKEECNIEFSDLSWYKKKLDSKK